MNQPNTLPIDPNAPLGIGCADLFSVSREQIKVMRHAIGYDEAGNDRYPNARSDDERRNRYVTAPEGDDGRICQELVSLKLMADHGPLNTTTGDNFYSVTAEGKRCVRLHAPLKPKLTRGQDRYRQWLRADCGMSFGEWMKLKRH